MSAYTTNIFKEPLQKRKKGNESNIQFQDTNCQLSEKEKKKKEEFSKKKEQNQLILKYTCFIVVPIILSALALFTRLYRITSSNKVVWDEAHFGKFSSYYIERQFYFDVHPPLGKTLIGLSGYLSGHNGTFKFNSGSTYPEPLNFGFMRAFCAIFGALCVPLAYFTAIELNYSFYASFIVGLMVLCDNSLATISRFILLDSMLLFFSMTTIYSLSKFHSYRHKPFSYRCIKWVGAFITALCGIYTIDDLWAKFGDYEMPKMSSLFQANLKGTNINKSPIYVAYGSRVTIKNMAYAGGLLHSHIQTFPGGSNQQQITCYHYKDDNNDWYIHHMHNEELISDEKPIQFLKNNDILRLIHKSTGCNLHSHNIPAPITKRNKEVSCYGNLTIGDNNDHWVIEVVKGLNPQDPRIKTIKTAFRLRHVSLNCYLRASRVHLPHWGFKQIEVTCDKSNNTKDYFTHWNIENHWNDRLPSGNTDFYKSSFWDDFIYANIGMMNTNNALILEKGKKDDLISSAWQWPTAISGIRMSSWDDDVTKFYMLGNPIVYWLSFASVLLFLGLVIFYTIRWKRHYIDFTPETLNHFHYSGVYPMLGWAFYYLPFFVIKRYLRIYFLTPLTILRVLYLHHYFPALLFAILTTGFVFDHFTRSLPFILRNIVFITICLVVSTTFIYFRDITFGMKGPSTQWAHLQWLPSWKISN
ncbi:hypothetical protein PCANB_001447 [Pneumocystis canis]|nr:hypothetical protein PCANB_001447 [Pneumocystis canis]